jgi:hypothetical protein
MCNLLIQGICSTIKAVYLSKNSFKLFDFSVADVVPDFVVREVCPFGDLASTMAVDVVQLFFTTQLSNFL